MKERLKTWLERSPSGWIHEAEIGVLVCLTTVLINIGWRSFKLLGPSVSWKTLNLFHIFDSGIDFAFFGMVLIGLGLFLVYKADDRTAHVSESTSDIARCVEAAVAGDLTADSTYIHPGKLGRLWQAVARLIAAFGRSENLVYHLAALVENSNDAIVSLKLDGTISIWNKGAQRIYGFSVEEAKGRPLSMLTPSGGEELQRNLELVLAGERVPPFEVLQQARNGRTVPALVRMSAILDSTHLVIGVCFCSQDLTDSVMRQRSQPAVDARDGNLK
jgi:PAS domain S-box-containing protein